MNERVCQGCGSPLPNQHHRRKWCSDQCRKLTLYGRPCIDCGKQVRTDSHHEVLRCITCSTIVTVERNRADCAAYQKLVEGMWAEGMTARGISEALGWKIGNPNVKISLMRGRGYNLPHRRTAEQRARIAAASVGHMEKARRVYREKAA